MTTNISQAMCATLESFHRSVPFLFHDVGGNQTSAGAGNLSTALISEDQTLGGAINVRFSPIRRTADTSNTVWESIRQIRDSRLKDTAEKLVQAIEEGLEILAASGKDLGLLPPIGAFRPEDGSFLLELASRNVRVGFSLEQKAEESSWYFVSLTDHGQAGISNPIHSSNLQKLAVHLLSLALAYS